MNNLPLVSIALCTYNGEKFLEEQLETIIQQTYKNLEIIVVDDCSKDNTYAILKKYEAAGKIKLYQNEKNLGFVKNFEKAISLCKGDYIALSDQDDIWDLRKIELQVKNIGDHLLIYHDSDLVDFQGNSLGKKMSDFFRFVDKNQNMSFLIHNCVSGHCMLFKKELTKYVFPIPDNFFHDWWMAYAATTIGNITYLEESLVKYRQHSSNFTDVLKMKEGASQMLSEKGTVIASPEERKARTERAVALFSMFHQFPYNKEKDKKFLSKLIKLYLQKEASYFFNFSLCLTLLKTSPVLYYIDKTKTHKEMNIFKESIGSQLKNKFHYYKKRLLK